jgi:divalent metal cation (Fe/Co/Zn/Cd) transporter
MNKSSLTRFAWLSIAAAVLTIGLKALAYQLTGSVGLLSMRWNLSSTLRAH